MPQRAGVQLSSPEACASHIQVRQEAQSPPWLRTLFLGGSSFLHRPLRGCILTGRLWPDAAIGLRVSLCPSGTWLPPRL